MTCRYELRPVGVFDRELARVIKPADGAPWKDYEAWLAAPGHINCPDPMPVEVVPLTLADAMNARVAEVETKAREQRQKVIYPAGPVEMASWAEKFRQALAFQAAPLDASAPMLAREAQERGVPTANIVARVLANAAAFTTAEARISGVSGKHKDLIRALPGVSEVQAYDVSNGWPF